ncbi:MAG: hypothetical protein ACKV0T_11345 [Planctomycetales bacterium]
MALLPVLLAVAHFERMNPNFLAGLVATTVFAAVVLESWFFLGTAFGLSFGAWRANLPLSPSMRIELAVVSSAIASITWTLWGTTAGMLIEQYRDSGGWASALKRLLVLVAQFAAASVAAVVMVPLNLLALMVIGFFVGPPPIFNEEPPFGMLFIAIGPMMTFNVTTLFCAGFARARLMRGKSFCALDWFLTAVVGLTVGTAVHQWFLDALHQIAD